MMRKIGRNLLNFQQLENLLKFLVTHGEISGYASQLKLKQLKRSEAVGKQTLGKVAGQFFEQIFQLVKVMNYYLRLSKNPILELGFNSILKARTKRQGGEIIQIGCRSCVFRRS
jgi:hypothetical protein